MYVVQAGQVEVVIEDEGGETTLSVLEPGDVFGEMALFSRSPRSATVRARGEARILTVDERGFLRRVHEDPSLAFRILEKLSERIDRLNREVLRLRQEA
jgi:CRP-like cAMP-binding protein